MKKPTQPKAAKPSTKSLVIKYLRAGKPIEDAASCAGIDEATALALISETSDQLIVTCQIAQTIADQALQDSYTIISEIAFQGELEETRLSAAKELRKFAFDLLKMSKPKETIATITLEQKDLWDS